MASSRRYERRGRGYEIDDQDDYNISQKRQRLRHEYDDQYYDTCDYNDRRRYWRRPYDNYDYYDKKTPPPPSPSPPPTQHEDKRYNTREEMNRLRDKPSYPDNNHHNMHGWSYSNGDHHHRYRESAVATDPRRENSFNQRQELKLLHDEPISNDHHSSHRPYSNLEYSDRNHHRYQCRESSVVDDDDSDSDDGEFSIVEESKHLPDVPHKVSLRPRSQIGYPDTTTNNNKFSNGTNKDDKNDNDNTNSKIRLKWSPDIPQASTLTPSNRKDFGESSDMEISDDEEEQDDGVDPSASDTRKRHEGRADENIMERIASTTAHPQMEKYDSISDKDKSAVAAFTAKDDPASANDDPFSCFMYVRGHDLLDTPGWKRFKNKCQVCYKPVKATDICSNITCKITLRNINIVKKKRTINGVVSQTGNAQREVIRQSVVYTNKSTSENSSTPGSDGIDKSNTQRSKSSYYHSNDAYSLPTFWQAPTTNRFAGDLQTMSEHSGTSICKANCKATAGGDAFTSRKVDHGQFSDVEDESFAEDLKYADASEGASLPVVRGIGTTTDNKATRYHTDKDAKDDDGYQASPSNDLVLRSQDLNDLLAVLKELVAADGSQADDHTVSTEPNGSTTDQLSTSIGNGANQLFQRMKDEPGKQNVELDRLVEAARLATMHFIKSKNDNDRLAKENEVIVEKERKARMELQEQKLASESLRGDMEREKAERASNENALKEKCKKSIEENVALVNETDNLRQQLQDRQKDMENERNLMKTFNNATQASYSKLKADYDALVKKEGNMQLDLQAQLETVEVLAQNLDKERSEKNALNERFHQTMQMYEVKLLDANQNLELHQSQKGIMENRIVKIQSRLQEAIKRAESYRSNNTATEGRLVEMQSQLRNANTRAASATAAQSKMEDTLNQVHNSWQEQCIELEAKEEEVSQLTRALKRERELRKDSGW